MIRLKVGMDISEEFVNELFGILSKGGYEYSASGFYGEYKVGKLRIGYYDAEGVLIIGVVSDESEND